MVHRLRVFMVVSFSNPLDFSPKICYQILRCQNPLALAEGCRHRPIELDQTVEKTFDIRSKMLYHMSIYGLGYVTFSFTLIDPNHPFTGDA